MNYLGQRLDKKCGASGIAANKKCSKATRALSNAAQVSRPAGYTGGTGNPLTHYSKGGREMWNANATFGERFRAAEKDYNQTAREAAVAATFGAYNGYRATRRAGGTRTQGLVGGALGSLAAGAVGAVQGRVQGAVLAASEAIGRRRLTASERAFRQNYLTGFSVLSQGANAYGTEMRHRQESDYTKRSRQARAEYAQSQAQAAANSAARYKKYGIDPNASAEEIKRQYKAAARKHHPDAGGSAESMKELNDLYAQLRKNRTGRKDRADSLDLGPLWDWAVNFRG